VNQAVRQYTGPARSQPAKPGATRRGPTPVALELAAALLVPAAVFGFTRVFKDSGAIAPIMGAALLSTALAALLRRVRVPLSLSVLVSLGFLLALVVNRFAPGTGRLGFIPTSATRDQFRFLIDDLVRDFQKERTPVPALEPFVASAMIGAWLMAFLTDWGAMRLRLAFEPVLPAGLLFIFSSVLGAGNNQVVSSVVFGLAVAAWAVCQRAANLADGNAWLADDRRRGALGVARLAAVFAVVAVFIGALAGPRLPGASAEEMLSLRDAGDPTRVVVSPYVNIESRLVEQKSTRLLTVASDQPAYWRMAGLDTYEDFIWKVAGNFSPQDGELPGQPELGGQRDPIRQDYTVENLDAIWLPAAFTPTEILQASAKVTWNAETSSLTVANDVPTSDGVTYSLISSVPRFTPDELRAAPELVPPVIVERYLPLPEIPELARTEAERVTAGAPTRYDQVLALQRYFREFQYSVELSPRTGDPIEQFLNERIGFCQQFAGTFAVMARYLGIPARVAIGFTWGDPVGKDPEGRTIFQVSGRQTHAWPEVWFDGLGWVAFEPTPGRGAPAGAAYTEVAAQQDSAIQPDNPGGPITTTTTAPSTALGTGNTVPLEPDIPLDSGGSVGQQSNGPSRATIVRVLAVVGVLAAYFGGLPIYHTLKRQRRRQRATTPATVVETSWAEVAETLELVYGIHRRPSETRREFAHRLGSDPRVPRQAMGALAEKATVARYYPQGLTDRDGQQASTMAGEIETSVTTRVSPYTRWKRLVDPRRVLHPPTRLTASAVSPVGPSTPTRPPSTTLNGSRNNGDRELVG
jgi:transglutaminase-like putative cysteine protease